MTSDGDINVLENGSLLNDLNEHISETTIQHLQDAFDFAIAEIREQEQRRWIPASDPPKEE